MSHWKEVSAARLLELVKNDGYKQVEIDDLSVFFRRKRWMLLS